MRRAVGGEIGCSQRDSGSVGRVNAKVGVEGVGDAAMNVGEGGFENAWDCQLSTRCHAKRRNRPVRSYIDSKGIPALAVQAATSQASLTSVSNRSFFPPSGGSSRIMLKCLGNLFNALTSL